MKRWNCLSACFVALIGAALSGAAFPQSYPAKPIRVLSTFGGGSVADGMMRLLGQKMSDGLGQQVIVEPQPGAGGVLAAQTVVRAAPDGYTLLHAAPTTLFATPFVLKTPPYDPMKDFTYITALADAMTCMVVAGDLPFRTVKEVIEYARANPGKLAYGSNGIGASYHLEMELLKQKNGIEITHVPYKGGQDGLNAAVAGQLPIAFAPAATAAAQMRGGKVRIIAVMSAKRWDGLPEVASMGEQLPDWEKIPSGNKMVGPAGMPAPVVARLYTEISRALVTPDMAERLKKIGFFAVGSTPEEFAAGIRKDMEIMAKGIKAAKIDAN